MSRLALPLLLALGCLLYAFRAAAGDLIAAWQTDEYSHGFLIPPVAALIAWHRLAERRPLHRPSRSGWLVLGLSATLLAVGSLAAFSTAAQYGLIVGLAGLCLSFLGRAATAAALPGFVYLCFAVPLPHIAYARLSEHLQLISSSLGVRMLDAVGVPAYGEGNVIDLGAMKLQVVEACSGLRYLFPLMSFGFLVAYLLQDRMWKRIVVFLSTVPMTIVINAMRIALIGVTVDRWGPAMAEGLLHKLEGWAIFMLCGALLLAEVAVLRRIGQRGRLRLDQLGFADGPLLTRSTSHTGAAPGAVMICILLALTTILAPTRTEQAPAHAALAGFPLEVDGWQGKSASLPPEVLEGLRLSDYFLADYTHEGAAEPVNFYIAYYATQRVGSAAHSPANCIPGGGWQIVSDRSSQVAVPGGTLAVSRLLIRKGDTAQLVYYWFDERGRDLTETYASKWYLLVDSVRLHRTDGALVRATTPIAAGETEKTAEARLNGFVADAHPWIGKFVPGREELK